MLSTFLLMKTHLFAYIFKFFLPSIQLLFLWDQESHIWPCFNNFNNKLTLSHIYHSLLIFFITDIKWFSFHRVHAQFIPSLFLRQYHLTNPQIFTTLHMENNIVISLIAYTFYKRTISSSKEKFIYETYLVTACLSSQFPQCPKMTKWFTMKYCLQFRRTLQRHYSLYLLQ